MRRASKVSAGSEVRTEQQNSREGHIINVSDVRKRCIESTNEVLFVLFSGNRRSDSVINTCVVVINLIFLNK